MNKVIRDGKVAILYSKDYGAGWYSWSKDERCLYSPEIVQLIEQNKRDEITDELCKSLFGDSFYSGGVEGLTIKWLPVGTIFKINEYDGSELIETIEDLYLKA